MIRSVVLSLLTLCLANAGCCYTGTAPGGWEMYTNCVRNLTEEPVRFGDRLLVISKIKQRAVEAWKAVCQASPEHQYSSDYADGFIAGFRDYVEAGGSGEPPGMPPFCYRLSCYHGPGQKAVLDWYAGFRHGSSIAKESGLREAILIPLGGLPEAGARKLETPIEQPTDPRFSGTLVPDQGQEELDHLKPGLSSPSSSPYEVLPKPRKGTSP